MNGTGQYIAARWQNALPVLIVLPLINLVPLVYHSPRALPLLLGLHLPVYMLHQVEEHLWPAGFRRFVNQQIFHSGDAGFPASAGAIAFVNIALVWLPVSLGAMPPILWQGFLWMGLAMVAVSLVNGLTHVMAAVKLRRANPGLWTAIFLLLPFSIWTLHGAFSQNIIGWPIFAILISVAVALHGAIALIMAWPWLRLPFKTQL
ncbi:MAG: HXXEE domain-containing protein [Hyphomicrobiales bacterium]|nr:HXXEE domain-containing protein [Hyphomicrobiales bacterium]MDE2116139.1 HXXEE domain-containing protein [Hyphomicrobiales bacterium]